ncbi:MAG: preprotein translocase subunit YajC [Clostridia bacterium]|nr:preprotein translocase subunit YajC [Clostridia bacterium]
MINFLCEAASGGNAVSKGVMTGLLIVVLLGMLIMPYFSQKKKSREYEEMINSLKSGDLVKTAGGIIGRINKIIDKGEIKTVVLETGSKTEKSYIEFDMNMIYCVLKSTKVENTETEEDLEDETVESDESVETEESTETLNETAETTEETTEVIEEPVSEKVEELVDEEVKTEEYKKPTPKVKVSTNKKSNGKNHSKKK